jgi:uncharacterized membrane protein SpoIIM required for sporulation
VTVDGFIAAHRHEWDELTAVLRHAGRDGRRLDPEELERLAALYQRVGTHLSMARTRYGDPQLSAELSTLVAAASALLHGRRVSSWRRAGEFATATLPAAVWHVRRAIVVAAALFLVPAIGVGAWLAASPEALATVVPQELRAAYPQDFAQYYTAMPSAQFGAVVTVRNIQVALLAFAGGALLAVPSAGVLVLNGAAGVGPAWALMASAGEQARFWTLILPHGLLELTAVFVAGGAGLQIGWALIDPGDRFRAVALREEGRRAISIVIGLLVAFAAAGVIEGFVTGAPWPAGLRVGVGVVVWAAFVAYAVVLGRRATAAGRTGAIGEEPAAGLSAVTRREPCGGPAVGRIDATRELTAARRA